MSMSDGMSERSHLTSTSHGGRGDHRQRKISQASNASFTQLQNRHATVNVTKNASFDSVKS